MNIDYTLWPNTDENLGNLKVQIPDGINTTWPEGDALVGNFVYKNGLLSGFVDTKALTVNDSKSTTFPYDYVNIHLASIKEGDMTVEGGAKPEYLIVTYGTGNSGDTIVLGTTYANCTDAAAIRNINSQYWNDSKYGGNVVDGVWSESLENLKTQFDTKTGKGGLFYCCTDMTHFYSDLSSLYDGQYMFTGCTELKTFEADLSNLQTAHNMFSYYSPNVLSSGTSCCISLTSFKANAPLLYDGAYMFCGCEALTSFENDLPSLEDGSYMFSGCVELKTIDADLSNLRTARNMFSYITKGLGGVVLPCTSLTSFNVDVPLLNDGGYMFCGCESLTSFENDLPSLTNGEYMFGAKSVSFGIAQSSYCFACPLKSFSVNISSLTNGNYMFNGCASLTSFSSALPKLETATGMFTECKLDTASIKNIAETINTVTESPSIHIGIGSTNPTEEENQYFTQIHNKGWQVYVSGSSSAYVPATATLDETGETMTSPIPFWAKPVPSDEKHARYIDSEGNYYNILGGQFIYVSDPETYSMFLNEEDAAANMRLTPYVKPIAEAETETENN